VRFLRSIALTATLGLLAPSAAFAEQPSGQDTAERQSEAEALARRAFDAYSKSDYTSALSLYQQALQIAPAAAIYFNIASIYDKKLPDPELAIEFYRKCLTAPDASPDLALKASARIQVLNQELAQKRAGTTGQSSTKPETPITQPDEPPAEPGRALRITGVVVGALGVAAVGVGSGFGIDAKVKLDRARKVCTAATCKTQSGVDDMKAAGSSATAATVLWIAGGVAIGAGIGLYLFAPRKPEPTSTSIRELRLDPVLGPTQAGLNLSGAFF
jgi:tetratricopeptide (TPR) repeat protein